MTRQGRSDVVLSGLMGLCVGDALGVPVEFSSRAEREVAPVNGMWGYGTWNQPAGTWSDDSSLTFCLAAALCEGFSLAQIAAYFCRWYTAGFWTPHGQVFDVGNATQAAIEQLLQGVSPQAAGGSSERSNGNGSLMRILPLAFYASTWALPQLLDRVHQVSALTHAHPRSQMACGLYVSIASCLVQGLNLPEAYEQGMRQVHEFYQQPPFAREGCHFQRILTGELATVPIAAIRSSGYVVDALEAALWCLLTSSSYPETVLKAVNLGDDTDTTGAIAGGLAGLYYGLEGIPAAWIEQIARREEIAALAQALSQAIAGAG